MTIAYFGYGSLVNLNSLRTPYLSAHRATLQGWKRSWLTRPRIANRPTNKDNTALLSAVAVPDAKIDGLLIIDHASSLAALDKREELYSRVTITASDLYFHDDAPAPGSHFLYVADHPAATQQTKILRSYLDVVMQGYLHHFGELGLQRFIESTLNFAIQIEEDREFPQYPRAISLSEKESRLFATII